MNNFGEQFLHQKYQKLHVSESVEHEQRRKERLGTKTSKEPSNKINDWLKVLEQTHSDHHNNPKVLDKIKEYYFKTKIIKQEDIPESTFILEQKNDKKKGREPILITDEFRQEKSAQIIAKQKRSLSKWLNYLSASTPHHPMWAKYWTFRSILTMGKLERREDKEKEIETLHFKKRSKDTTASFPVLNPRALAATISAISDRAEQKNNGQKEKINSRNLSTKLNDEEFKELLSGGNFSKIYAQFLKEIPEYSQEGLEETRGEWVVYKQGSKPDGLVKSLEQYPLEWCTADYDTAKEQLKDGDFYVYYSINKKGEAVIPRVAIRMEEKDIAELRGIATNQNLDPYINDVVLEKMKEFPDAEESVRKIADMERLSEIEDKSDKQEKLLEDDLNFLYEINHKIQSFGVRADPRIEEIIIERNVRADLSLVLGYLEKEISLTNEEALGGDIKYHYKDLSLNKFNFADALVLPQIIGGDLDLANLKSAVGLKFPLSVEGDLNLQCLESVKGLNLPEFIGGFLILNSLKSAEGLNLPKFLGGDLDLSSLKSAVGLKLPQPFTGSLYLDSLESAESLDLPKLFSGNLYLNNLKSAAGLKLSESIVGDLDLSGLKSAENLILPQSVGGCIYLDGLEQVERDGLKNKYSNLNILP